MRASTSCCNCSASTAHQTHLLLLHTYSPIHTAASVDVALACASESLADGGLWSNLGDVRASLTTGCAEECEARKARPVRVLTTLHPFVYYAALYRQARSGRRSVEAAVLSKLFNTTRRERVPPLASLGAFVSWVLRGRPMRRWSSLKKEWQVFEPISWSLSSRLAARCGSQQCESGFDAHIRHEQASTDAVELVGRLWPDRKEAVAEMRVSLRTLPAVAAAAAAAAAVGENSATISTEIPSVATVSAAAVAHARRCPYEEAARAGALLRAWRPREAGSNRSKGEDLRSAVLRHDAWAFAKFGYPTSLLSDGCDGVARSGAAATTAAGGSLAPTAAQDGAHITLHTGSPSGR